MISAYGGWGLGRAQGDGPSWVTEGLPSKLPLPHRQILSFGSFLAEHLERMLQFQELLCLLEALSQWASRRPSILSRAEGFTGVAQPQGRGPREVRNRPWRGQAGRQSGLADSRATAHPTEPFGKGGGETRPGGPSTHPQCVSVRLQAPCLLPPFKGKGEVISLEGPSGSCLTFPPSHTHPTLSRPSSINLPPRLGTRELLKGKGLRGAAAHREEAQPPAPPSTCASSRSPAGRALSGRSSPGLFPRPKQGSPGQPASFLLFPGGGCGGG